MLSFVEKDNLMNDIINLKKSINKLEMSFNPYNLLLSINNSIRDFISFRDLICNKYYNYKLLPSVLINCVFGFLPYNYLFFGQSICKDWEKFLVEKLKNKTDFLYIHETYNLPHKYNNFAVERNKIILLSDNKLYNFCLKTKTMSKPLTNYKYNFIVTNGYWCDINHCCIHIHNNYNCYINRGFFHDSIYVDIDISSVAIDDNYVYVIEGCHIRIYTFNNHCVKEWYLGNKNAILLVYNENLFCTNKNGKCIEVFSFNGTLIAKWEKYSDDKLFDNIIDFTNNDDIFYILNGKSIISLTWTGEFIFEYISPHPLTKIVYSNGFLYGYSYADDILITFKIHKKIL